MRKGRLRFAQAENASKIVRLFTTTNLVKSLYACANGAEQDAPAATQCGSDNMTRKRGLVQKASTVLFRP
jgi:hypothetical protein